MNMRDLIPWGRSGNSVPTAYRDGDDPFLALHREVNRLFDDVMRGFDAPMPLGRPSNWSSWPKVELSETDRDIRVTAEVPGMDEKDIEVELDDGVLALRGEKKSETEDKERHFSDRFYGRFARQIGLGAEIDEDKVSASFRNGVLTVVLPKTERAQSRAKRIAINGSG